MRKKSYVNEDCPHQRRGFSLSIPPQNHIFRGSRNSIDSTATYESGFRESKSLCQHWRRSVSHRHLSKTIVCEKPGHASGLPYDFFRILRRPQSALYPVMALVDLHLAKWIVRKHKRARRSLTRAFEWLRRIRRDSPKLFAHWCLAYES